MLRVNQLSGFGGRSIPAVVIQTGEAFSTNSPSFTIDLGPPGVKQVMVVFSCYETTNGADPWAFGTGSIGGESFTYAVGGGEETAGNGTNFTGGATVRALETSLSGTQTVSMSIVGFGNLMTATRMLAAVTRGFSTTPVSYDGGDNQGASNGNDVTLNTAGARLVLCAAAASSAPDTFQGPGDEVTAVASGQLSLGYDLSPPGGGSDVYSFTGGKYIIAGAAFG